MVKIDNDFLLETLRTLVSINSVLPHEAEAAAYLAEVVRGLGLEPTVVAPGLAEGASPGAALEGWLKVPPAPE